MRVSTAALAITLAILWGGSILLVGTINLAAPSFGAGYLATMSSLHPGFQLSQTFPDVLVGTLAGVVDGLLAGLLLGWFYNFLVAVLPGKTASEVPWWR